MENIIKSAIERIVHIPTDFHQVKTKSVLTLLRESGYFELHDKIHESDIYELLKTHPQLINEWLGWSDDKCSTPTWFFTRGEDGKCLVRHSPDGNDFEEIKTTDAFEACAAFIKREIESTRILFIE